MQGGFGPEQVSRVRRKRDGELPTGSDDHPDDLQQVQGPGPDYKNALSLVQGFGSGGAEGGGAGGGAQGHQQRPESESAGQGQRVRNGQQLARRPDPEGRRAGRPLLQKRPLRRLHRPPCHHQPGGARLQNQSQRLVLRTGNQPAARRPVWHQVQALRAGTYPIISIFIKYLFIS